MNLDQSFEELENNLRRLRERYISPHLQSSPSADSELDVKSFCVFSHALFEQFIEEVCIYVAESAKSAWDTPDRVVTRPLLTLICFGIGKRCSTDSSAATARVGGHDVVRNAVNETVNTYLSYLRSDNHGITSAHLRKMLWPVAIEIPSDARYGPSLEQLIKNRGFHAHGYDIKKIIAPTDVLNWTNDCVDFCRDIKNSGNRYLISAYPRPSEVQSWWRRILIYFATV